MWALIAKSILRYRVLVLVLLTLTTVFMAYQAKDVKLLYGLPKMLPEDDPIYLAYTDFNERFKTKSTVFVVGLERNPFSSLELFNAWFELGESINKIEGVDTVLSAANVINVVKDDSLKQFNIAPIVSRPLLNDTELDSVRQLVENLPFFQGLLFNDSTTLMAVSLNNVIFNSEHRGPLLNLVLAETEKFSQSQGIELRHSGLPYIRTVITKLVKKELKMFVILAILVTVLILLLFFRSIKPVVVSMMVVILGVIWSMGSMALFDFEITILTSIIPPLIIVIGIPNCIYLINKYHSEFKNHGNKAKALTQVVQKIGKATFITNATTAIGFLTFIFTESEVLVEFGYVASMNIMMLFGLSLLIITTVFSFLSPPREKLTAHLDKSWVRKAVTALVNIVTYRRKLVYVVTVVLVSLGIYGVSLVQTTGNMVDDLPTYHPVTQDLKFFENNYKGIMPFEIAIDTKKKGGATRSKMLTRIDKMQQLFASYPQFSKPISVVEGIKFTKQAFYNGNPEKFELITNREKAFFQPYLEDAGGTENVLSEFLDSTKQVTRVSLKMADVGTLQMDSLIEELTPRIDSIFNPNRHKLDSLVANYQKASLNGDGDSALLALMGGFPSMKRSLVKMMVSEREKQSAILKDPAQFVALQKASGFEDYLADIADKQITNITLTGSSVVFLQGTNYLVKNLFISLSIAIFMVALIMALFFGSFKMILVSLVTNLIPLLLTAACMGYFGISIKPSTILVFSIAFGISVDDTIHFLAKYRQELKFYNGHIGQAVTAALKEIGVSMIYTSIILFFGFSVFDSSEFGGTMALGILVSFTLLVAMLANLVLLPTFLMSFQQALNVKAMREPFLEVMNEEEDIDLESLTIQKDLGASPPNGQPLDSANESNPAKKSKP